MPSLAQQAQSIADLYQPPATGRPSDIGSSSTVTQFLEAVGEGNYIDTAAKLAGLSKVTVYEWLKRGETGEQPFERFANAVKEAEARAEAKMLANVRKASELPQFWAAGMTVLERRHPERWGKRQDDQQTPRVVVQIGVGQGEVKVGLITNTLSPDNINDLACGNQGQVEMLSPINRNYVNQLEPSCESVPAPVSEADRQFPAGELAGGPNPPLRGAGGQPRRLLVKGRSPSKTRKRGAK